MALVMLRERSHAFKYVTVLLGVLGSSRPRIVQQRPFSAYFHRDAVINGWRCDEPPC
jgi:hypothetical protein